MSEDVKTFVLNGWAASPDAWKLCTFKRDAVFSYIDHLDGKTEAAFAAAAGGAVLVGWSMGASYALRLALKSPARVRALVLVAATPRMMQDEGWPGMTERRLSALEMGLKMTMGGGGFSSIPARLPNPYVMDSDANLKRGLDYLRSTDLRAELEAKRDAFASLPCVLFQSEKDPVVRASNAGYLKGIFARAQLHMIPGAEHALPIFIPEQITSAIQTATSLKR